MLRAIRLALGLSGLESAPGQGANRHRGVQVVLTGREEIVALNRRHLGRSEATDVLAFDLRPDRRGDPSPDVTAEIYVCLDVAAEAAHEYNTAFAYEVLLYIVHGLLHLAGEDDHTPAARARMRRAEFPSMSSRRAQIEARAPCSASFSATAKPRPSPAPATRAVLSFSPKLKSLI